MLKKAALVFGIVFVVLGVYGFFTGSDSMLFGVFHVNTLHNIIHLVSGIVALAVAGSDKNSKLYFQVFGIIYLLVTILGFVYGNSEILGVVAQNTADTYLHLVIALASLYLGFGTKEAALATA